MGCDFGQMPLQSLLISLGKVLIIFASLCEMYGRYLSDFAVKTAVFCFSLTSSEKDQASFLFNALKT